MNTKAKSIAILLSTLVLGGLIGGLVVGMISQKRTEEIGELRKKGGFIRHMERVIEPEDSVQHNIIHPILEATDARNREILVNVRKKMRVSFDSMLVDLEPYLSSDQMSRLKEEQKRMSRRRKGPPGLPPHDRRRGRRKGPPQGGKHN